MINVHFVLLPNSLLLDIAGPAEVLRVSNQTLTMHGREAQFALHFVGVEASCVTSVGLSVCGLKPLPNLHAASGCHWVLVLGKTGPALDLESVEARQTLAWLGRLPLLKNRVELMCVCAGAVIAARAGLLAHRRVTTHHQHLADLQMAEPLCAVQSNRVFVSDGPVWSSAGVTTGIDLMLHRVAAECGPLVAAEVAQTLVLAFRRGPHDPELSPFLRYRHHLHRALHRVQDAVTHEPQTQWSLSGMAQIACTSERHLARLFKTHIGIGPLHYVWRIRLAFAQTALRSGHKVTQAAQVAGFASATQLRRAWREEGLAGLPSQHYLK